MAEAAVEAGWANPEGGADALVQGVQNEVWEAIEDDKDELEARKADVCRRFPDPDTLNDCLYDQIYQAEAEFFGKQAPARRVPLPPIEEVQQ